MVMDGKKLEYKGEKALKELEKLTANAAEVQEEAVKMILTQNKGTEYLNKYMAGVESKSQVPHFKRCVPVTTYKDVRPYIQRIANGDNSNLITSQPVTEMLCRSLSSLYPLSIRTCV